MPLIALKPVRLIIHVSSICSGNNHPDKPSSKSVYKPPHWAQMADGLALDESGVSSRLHRIVKKGN